MVLLLVPKEQQRTRRFRSIKEARMQDEIYSKPELTGLISIQIVLLLGQFSYLNCHNIYVSYCKDKFDELKVKIILDDCQNQGEGEHKILQHIKDNTWKKSVVFAG